jgi:peptidoglycan/LPS O-acetylase OafA/YrhL
VSPGASGADAITVGGTNGFTGSVTLSASIASSPQGAQDPPTLSFGSTSPVTVTAGGTAQATLAIDTTAATSGALSYPPRGSSPFALAGGAALACLLMFALPKKRRRWPATLAMLALLATVGAMAGCGGGGGGSNNGNPGTTPGNYTVTVTATSGSTTQTTTVTIAVE